MSDLCKTLDVEHCTTRVRYGLSEHSLCIRTECSLDLLIRGLLRNERAVDTELFQRHTEEIIGAAIDLVGGNEVIASLTDVEDGVEVGSLTARSEHCTYTALQCGYFCSYRIVGRILQTGIEIAFLL